MKPLRVEKPPITSSSISQALRSEHSMVLVAVDRIFSREWEGTNKFSSFPPYGGITSDLEFDNDCLKVIRSKYIRKILPDRRKKLEAIIEQQKRVLRTLFCCWSLLKDQKRF